MRRALAAAAVLCLALTGCGGNDEPAATETPEETATSSSPSETAAESASPTPTEDSSPEREAIEIEIEGDKIEPNGRRVKVAAGEPILLEIESDRAAELHVHSSPEQELAVKKGESTQELTIDRPGVVDIEEHDTGIVIVQLEVR
jgi:hypothetical protein